MWWGAGDHRCFLVSVDHSRAIRDGIGPPQPSLHPRPRRATSIPRTATSLTRIATSLIRTATSLPRIVTSLPPPDRHLPPPAPLLTSPARLAPSPPPHARARAQARALSGPPPCLPPPWLYIGARRTCDHGLDSDRNDRSHLVQGFSMLVRKNATLGWD